MIEFNLLIADQFTMAAMAKFLTEECGFREIDSAAFALDGIHTCTMEPGQFSAMEFCRTYLKKDCSVRVDFGLSSQKVQGEDLLGALEVLQVADRFSRRFPNDFMLYRNMDIQVIIRSGGRTQLNSLMTWSEARKNLISGDYTWAELEY